MTPADFYRKHAPPGTDRGAEAARETFAHDLEVMLQKYGVIQPLPRREALTGPYQKGQNREAHGIDE